MLQLGARDQQEQQVEEEFSEGRIVYLPPSLRGIGQALAAWGPRSPYGAPPPNAPGSGHCRPMAILPRESAISGATFQRSWWRHRSIMSASRQWNSSQRFYKWTVVIGGKVTKLCEKHYDCARLWIFDEVRNACCFLMGKLTWSGSLI